MSIGTAASSFPDEIFIYPQQRFFYQAVEIKAPDFLPKKLHLFLIGWITNNKNRPKAATSVCMLFLRILPKYKKLEQQK